MTRDLPLQPFRLKHLTLKNRIMSTPHELAGSLFLGSCGSQQPRKQFAGLFVSAM